MAFTMIPLPYDRKALEPYMSERTLDFHYGQHYKTYVDKLNALIKGTEYETMTLEEICEKTEPGPIYNNGAQAWNHAFFWNSMTPNGGGEPEGKLLDLINKRWGNFDEFKSHFSGMATAIFGSGYGWLVQKEDGTLEIKPTGNAVNPLGTGEKPLLTIDVWEHAYYLDYQNVRPQFVENFIEHLVNWKFVEGNLRQ